MQSEGVGQEIALTINMLLGSCWITQLVPPLVVATGSGCPPPRPTSATIQQSLAVAQDTAKAVWTLGCRCWMTQVWPPSLVTRILRFGAVSEVVLPTAQQSLAVGHEMPTSVARLAGSFWLAQVLPPSVVAITNGPTGPVALDNSPTTQQVLTVAQVIPRGLIE